MADDSSGFEVPDITVPDTFDQYSSDTINLDDSMLGDVWDFIKNNSKALLSIGSGIYGLYEADQQKDMAKKALAAGDPFGAYRGVYGAQLLQLMANPSSITSDPGYQFQFDQGQQAVTRNMAARGFLDSGNEGIALEQYGQGFAQNYLNNRINQLSQLAGAGISPNQSGLNTYNTGIDTASAALASLGYGLTRSGSPAGTPGSHPSAAGGEAAKSGSSDSLSQIGTGLSLLGSGAGLVGKATGGTAASTIGSTAGDLGQIASGVAKGDVGGYAQAATGAANLAGVDTAGWGGIISTGVDLSKGNYGQAGFDAAGVLMGSPISALGNLAASYLNKAFLGNGSKDRNDALYKQVTGASVVSLPLGHMGVTYRIIKDGDQYRLLSNQQWDDLAGSFYGATVAPDGNQAEWQQKYKDTVADVLANPAKHIGDFDAKTGKIMLNGKVVGNYGS